MRIPGEGVQARRGRRLRSGARAPPFCVHTRAHTHVHTRVDAKAHAHAHRSTHSLLLPSPSVQASKRAGRITPVPGSPICYALATGSAGGVGPMTIAMLMLNTLKVSPPLPLCANADNRKGGRVRMTIGAAARGR
eukprot:3511224-Rhodomonas_salina.2